MRCYFDARGDCPPGDLEVADVYGIGLFPSGQDRPYTLLNMISSLDGKAVFGEPGSTWRLGSATDHALFQQLRRGCDGILAGAGLMAADDPPFPWPDEAERRLRVARGLRPVPLWIIVSGRASLPPDLRVFKGGCENVLVIADRSAPAENLQALAGKAQILSFDGPELDWHEVGRRLRSEHGIQRLYAIGGPTLNASMLEAQILDELFVTLSPKIQGGSGMATMFEGKGFPEGQWPQAKLLTIHGVGDELFLRYDLNMAD